LLFVPPPFGGGIFVIFGDCGSLRRATFREGSGDPYAASSQNNFVIATGQRSPIKGRDNYEHHTF
jgi:hypothetical protein